MPIKHTIKRSFLMFQLAGAVRNNDIQCHLDPKTGLYTKADELDYPSIGQIDSLLLQNKVKVLKNQ